MFGSGSDCCTVCERTKRPGTVHSEVVNFMRCEFSLRVKTEACCKLADQLPSVLPRSSESVRAERSQGDAVTVMCHPRWVPGAKKKKDIR